MSYTISGTTLNVYNATATGLILFATIDSGTIPTTASLFAPGAYVIDLSTGVTYRNTGTTATPVFTGGVTNNVQAAVATTDGTTTGTISPASTHVSVTSSGATKQIILPAPVVGKQIVIDVGANGFDLKTSDPTNIAINGGSGASAKSAIAASSTCYMICISATAWKGFFLDADSDVAKVPAAA